MFGSHHTVRRLVVFALLLVSARAEASFHLWKIKEVYSNWDGSQQFVEMFDASANENFVGGHTLAANSDGNVVTFTFPANLPSNMTANHHMLLATPGFEALPGAKTPDYIIPTHFFDPNAASLSLAFGPGNFDVLSFAGSLLPHDGVNSLTDAAPGGIASLSAGTNSPTNFATQSGSVSLFASATLASDFTMNGVVDGGDLASLEAGFGQEGSLVRTPNGDSNGDLSVDGADALALQQQLGSPPPAFSAIPEPGGFLVALWLFAPVSLGWRLRQTRRHSPDPG